MDTNTLKVDVKLQIKDVLRYNLYIAYQSHFSKIVLLVGIAISAWMVYGFFNTELRWDIYLSQNIIMIIVGVFAIVATPFKVWTITAVQMQSPVFAGTSYYTFSVENIHLKVGELEDTIPWETYSTIKETNKDFRFFVDRVQAQIVPKHNMKKEGIEQLRSLIKTANPKEIYQLRG